MPEFSYSTAVPSVNWRFQVTAENLTEVAQWITDTTEVTATVVNDGIEWEYGVLPVVHKRAEIGNWLFGRMPIEQVSITSISIWENEPVGDGTGQQAVTTTLPKYTITE